MVSLQDIETLVLTADSYMLELGEQKNSEQKKGCSANELVAQIAQMIMLKEQLNYQVSIGDFGDRATLLYNCLSTAVQTFSGSNMAIDPNAVVPGVTIIVQQGAVPQWFDVPWADMESEDEDVNGARYTFRSEKILGWNPSVQDGTNLFELGVHYDMYADGTQGVFRFREGFGIYEGSYIRFDNFQAYVAPPLPLPTLGTALIDNQSSFDVQYNDNGSGMNTLPSGQQFFKDPIDDGQFLYIDLPSGTTTIYTAYNSDGSVFFTDTFISPPSTGFNNSNMEISKRYTYIVTNS